MQAWDDFTITLRVKKRGSSRKLVGFRKDSLRRCAPAPSEGTPSGASRQLPLRELPQALRASSLWEGAFWRRNSALPPSLREVARRIRDGGSCIPQLSVKSQKRLGGGQWPPLRSTGITVVICWSAAVESSRVTRVMPLPLRRPAE